jgi:four helix bundle protein
MDREFTRMESWKKAHELTLDVYEIARKLPEDEQELLGNEMCGSALMIGGNIARGCPLDDADFRDALEAAVTSARELQTQLFVARDLRYLSAKEVERLAKRAEKVRDLIVAQIKECRVPK